MARSHSSLARPEDRRSHAIRLAQEGAGIITLDACADFDSVPYGLATREDLKETVAQIKSSGRRVVSHEGDVRKFADVTSVVEEGVAELGRLDIVIANAGVVSYGTIDQLTEEVAVVSSANHPFPELWTEANDISNAVLFLASDEARHISGAVLPIDLGELAR